MFDVYWSSILKARRGVKSRVTRDGKISPNLWNFLRDNDNKAEQFNFLGDKIACVATPNVVIVTKEDEAVRDHTINLAGVL